MRYDSIANNTKVNETKIMPFIYMLVGIIFHPVKTIKQTSYNQKFIYFFPFVAISSVTPWIIRFNFNKNKIMNDMISLNVPKDQIYNSINKVIAYNFIVLPLVALISFIFWFILIFGVAKLMNGEGKLRQYIILYGYTTPIYFLFACATTIFSFITGNILLDASLFGVLTHFTSSLNGFLTGFLKQIDIFKIWKYFIIFQGLLHISKLSKRKALIIVIGIFIFSGVFSGIGEMLKQVLSQLK